MACTGTADRMTVGPKNTLDCCNATIYVAFSLKPAYFPLIMSSNEKNSKPQSDRVYEAKYRKCLKCRTEFLSEWPGERVCKACKSTSAWRDGLAA